jgi:hypothetical protein
MRLRGRSLTQAQNRGISQFVYRSMNGQRKHIGLV